jgi:hypothetical protein
MHQTQPRTGDNGRVPFRSSRYFCSNGVWFFMTRGGGQKGPFASKQEMEAELMMFIREQSMMNGAITNG